MSFDFLASLVLAHGYLVVFFAIALDCAALPIPGELLLLTVGGLAVQGRLDPVWAISLATAGAILADSISYWMGRLGGDRVIARVGFRGGWKPGLPMLMFGRFVIGARLVVAPLAGARRLPYGRFVLCNMVGCALWAAAYVMVGYLAGRHLAALQQHWSNAATTLQILVAIAVVAFVTIKFFRARWTRTTLGAAMLALFSIRATTLMFDDDELEPVPVRVRVNR